MRVKHRSDGAVKFAIDGGGEFSLAPQLAEVLKFLASGDTECGEKDAVATWRSRPEILKFLEEAAGRKFRKSYVNNIVYRLREALGTNGYDRRLIQSHRQKGVRLAIKRGAQCALDTSVDGW